MKKISYFLDRVVCWAFRHKLINSKQWFYGVNWAAGNRVKGEWR